MTNDAANDLVRAKSLARTFNATPGSLVEISSVGDRVALTLPATRTLHTVEQARALARDIENAAGIVSMIDDAMRRLYVQARNEA